MTAPVGSKVRIRGHGSTMVAALLAATIIALAVMPGAGGAAVRGASRTNAKVAIVVGPVGSLTDYYRSLADEAASVARRHANEVVTVYSPNATWPRVRRALQGASLVVYLGHGNGWPSPYRDQPYPPTQNGLGLNPIAGRGDDAHQYFGESYLAKLVHLAPGAVVVLSHLCYASGNPEPGGPEPTLSVAIQRADNYAAGWLAAGAAAVIAEAHSGPAYYVDAIFRSDASIERIWTSAPTFHDHVVQVDSARTPGRVVMLDPDHDRDGYNRSLAARPGIRSSGVLAAASHRSLSPGGTSAGSAVTVIPRTAAFGVPDLARAPIAGGRSTVSLPLVRTTLDLLPDHVTVGLRWDLIQASGPLPSSSLPVDPALVSGTPPAIDLVAPETLGTVVTTGPTEVVEGRLAVEAQLPDRPGLYRLVTTLHDRDGVAVDAATQARIPALLVQVTGPVWASYSMVDSAAVRPSASLPMSIRVANSGREPWALPVDSTVAPSTPSSDSPIVVARWLALDTLVAGEPVPNGSSSPMDVPPGSDRLVHLTMTAPGTPGHYLLVIDIVAPGRGSLSALGVPSGIVHVTVDPAAATIPAGWDAPTRLRWRTGR